MTAVELRHKAITGDALHETIYKLTQLEEAAYITPFLFQVHEAWHVFNKSSLRDKERKVLLGFNYAFPFPSLGWVAFPLDKNKYLFLQKTSIVKHKNILKKDMPLANVLIGFKPNCGIPLDYFEKTLEWAASSTLKK